MPEPLDYEPPKPRDTTISGCALMVIVVMGSIAVLFLLIMRLIDGPNHDTGF